MTQTLFFICFWDFEKSKLKKSSENVCSSSWPRSPRTTLSRRRIFGVWDKIALIFVSLLNVEHVEEYKEYKITDIFRFSRVRKIIKLRKFVMIFYRTTYHGSWLRFYISFYILWILDDPESRRGQPGTQLHHHMARFFGRRAEGAENQG